MAEKILNYIISHLFEIITVLIALYWAILSTFNYLKGRGWIKIDFSYSVLTRWFFSFKKNKDKMILSIVNIGNQVETINMIWFYINTREAKFLSFIDEIVYWKFVHLPKKNKSIWKNHYSI